MSLRPPMSINLPGGGGAGWSITCAGARYTNESANRTATRQARDAGTIPPSLRSMVLIAMEAKERKHQLVLPIPLSMTHADQSSVRNRGN